MFSNNIFSSYLYFWKGPFFAPWIPPGNVIRTSLDSIFHSVFCVFPSNFSLYFRFWLHTACLYRYFLHIWSLTVFVNFYHGMICSLSVLLKRMTCIFPTLSRVFKLNSNTVYFSKLSYGWFCTLFARVLHRCCEQPMLLDHVLTFCGLSIFTSISSTLSYSFFVRNKSPPLKVHWSFPRYFIFL